MIFGAGAFSAVVVAAPGLLGATYPDIDNERGFTALGADDLHSRFLPHLFAQGDQAVIDDFLRDRAGCRDFFFFDRFLIGDGNLQLVVCGDPLAGGIAIQKDRNGMITGLVKLAGVFALSTDGGGKESFVSRAFSLGSTGSSS